MRIICGTDFSLHAAEAANVAAIMAARLNQDLVLMHVAPVTDVSPDKPESYGSVALKQLQLEAERLRKFGPPVVTEELLKGSPYDKLVNAGHFSSTQ